jgi:hypothetical protein
LPSAQRHGTISGFGRRPNELLDPVWNRFDLAPEGRGDFQRKLDYPWGSGK